MINVFIWLVVGGMVGWLASVVMYTDGHQGIVRNVLVGVVGAALGGWFISPLLGVGAISEDVFNVGALLVSLIGAIILLALTNLVRRGPVR